MTEAERERLAMLSEEAGEIVQMIGKILRHGYESYHPDDLERETNRELLIKELNDLDGILWGMCQNGDLGINKFGMAKAVAAWEKKLKWTHYQKRIE